MFRKKVRYSNLLWNTIVCWFRNMILTFHKLLCYQYMNMNAIKFVHYNAWQSVTTSAFHHSISRNLRTPCKTCFPSTLKICVIILISVFPISAWQYAIDQISVFRTIFRGTIWSTKFDAFCNNIQIVMAWLSWELN